MRYYRFANKDYLEFAEKHALFGTPPVQVIMQMYSEPLQKFRLAGRRDSTTARSRHRPIDRERLATYFDPLPFWYAPLGNAQRRARDDVSVPRDHAAADDDVSLVGFAERVAAADPRARTACT